MGLLEGAPMTPLSRIATSSLSLLVSLLATLTATSGSPIRRLGVIGEGRGDAWSIVVGDATLAVGVADEGR